MGVRFFSFSPFSSLLFLRLSFTVTVNFVWCCCRRRRRFWILFVQTLRLNWIGTYLTPASSLNIHIAVCDCFVHFLEQSLASFKFQLKTVTTNLLKPMVNVIRNFDNDNSVQGPLCDIDLDCEYHEDYLSEFKSMLVTKMRTFIDKDLANDPDCIKGRKKTVQVRN